MHYFSSTWFIKVLSSSEMSLKVTWGQNDIPAYLLTQVFVGILLSLCLLPFGALTKLVGQHEWHQTCKKSCSNSFKKFISRRRSPTQVFTIFLQLVDWAAVDCTPTAHSAQCSARVHITRWTAAWHVASRPPGESLLVVRGGTVMYLTCWASRWGADCQGLKGVDAVRTAATT